jgi:NADH-ubiquinone oxidoreductase chain 1
LFPLFYIFFIASIAETNRAPFDLAEAESELVSGFMTEHAAGIFVFFFLGEYASIILICILITLILLGGYDMISIFLYLEEILYTFIYFFFSLIYTLFISLNLFILSIFSISETIISNNTFNLLFVINNIKETLQFNQYIDIINNIYYNYIVIITEYAIYNLREKFYLLDNLNIIIFTIKNISDNHILISLMYALGLSIKTIILIFSFI